MAKTPHTISDAILTRPNGSEHTPAKANGSQRDVFRSFIENLPVMFYAVGPKPPHTPIYISPTFEQFGYPIDDWMTQPDIWDRVIHADDRTRILEGTRDAMRRGESIDFEYRVVRNDGEIIWVRDRSCFIKDADGNKLCWQGVILDITARVKAEQEIARRERLYQMLAAHLKRSSVLLFDKDLRFTLAEGMQPANGRYTRADLEGNLMHEVFPRDVVEEWKPIYERALAGEDISFEHESENGYFQVDLQPVRDENGDIFA
ncbi:MAG: PAS domain-containing protein, partial [Pyrinomonadaceae bacterium]